MTAQFSNAMTGSGRTPGPWLFALPGFVTISFVFDMFDLGQPNLVLLAMMLFGFWLLQHGRPWMAGSMFALATAIKVFPVAVFPYLVWRRQWASAASMVVFFGMFLFVVPAPVRGYPAQRCRTQDLVSGNGGIEFGVGVRTARRAELVVGQSVHHRGDASADAPGQLQPGQFGQAAGIHEFGRSRFQDGELGRARDIVCDRARIHRRDAAALADDAALRCRGTWHPVLSDDGGVAAGAAILFHVAVLSDDHPDTPRSL